MGKIEMLNCCIIEIIRGELYKGFAPLCMETENIKCKYKPGELGKCLYREYDDNGDICTSVSAIRESISMVEEFIVEINNHIDKKVKSFTICRDCDKNG
jgi:hypothetical protein